MEFDWEFRMGSCNGVLRLGFDTVCRLLDHTESFEEKKAEKVIGVLGDSVTFHLKTSEPFMQIVWMTLSSKRLVASVKPGQPCEVHVPFFEFVGRVNAPEDCRRLQITNLGHTDSETYRALIIMGDEQYMKEDFELKVYRSHGNDVEYSLISDNKTERLFGNPLLIWHSPQGYRKVTCTARNPVSTASKTVSINQVCEVSFEEKKAEKVIGVLGESVTFHLKTSEPFTQIIWVTLSGRRLVALVKSGQPCEVHVPFLEFVGRVNAPEDCRRLQITNLRHTDSKTYRALIITGDEQHMKEDFELKVYRRVNAPEDCRRLQITNLGHTDSETYRALIITGDDQHMSKEHFELKVYKLLSESHLEVQCEKDALDNGKEIVHLACSAGSHGNDVEYSLTLDNKTERLSGNPLPIWHNTQDDRNVTCTATNPVSSASKTVSINQACEESFEEKKAEKVIGVLGESVTFHLKTSEPFTQIFWLTLSGRRRVASVKPGQPCEVHVSFPEFVGRVNAPEDCRRLQITNLGYNDSETYRALIISKGNEQHMLKEDFELKVYSSHGNDVEYSLTLDNKTERLSGNPLLIWHNTQDDRNVTCTAMNPVSSASKTVSINQACEESFEEKKAEKVIGVLGESVTFHLKTSEPFTQIIWLTLSGRRLVTLVKPGQPCEVHVSHEFVGRVNALEDCRRLQITNLGHIDSETYRALIITGDEQHMPKEDFELKVYSSHGNDVEYSLTLDNKTERLSGNPLPIWHNTQDDRNVTCTATNPVSSASKTVSINQACEESFEEKKAEKVIGVLGESVTFHLKTSEPFTQIFWLTLSGRRLVALVKPGQPCEVHVSPEFVGRVNAPEDCRRLQITNLGHTDSETYRALIITGDEQHMPKEDFELKVYSSHGNDVEYSLTLDNKTERLSGNPLPIWHNTQDDRNVTCTATNPVSSASKTVSINQACEESLEKKKVEKVIGVLGESVTFHLKTSEPFTQIFWLTLSGRRLVALVKPGQPCEVHVSPEFEGRVNAPEDCSRLQITNLGHTDSETYRALIITGDEQHMPKEDFELKVYRSHGNDVEYSLTSDNKTERLSGNPLPIWHNPQDDRNVTCTATNPVSTASKTVSITQACEVCLCPRQQGGPSLLPDEYPPSVQDEEPPIASNSIWKVHLARTVVMGCIQGQQTNPVRCSCKCTVMPTPTYSGDEAQA
ncbi:UNVERIFIED_CONTAM: hypothetical protein K2H54_013650 [Gekko kuhli]